MQRQIEIEVVYCLPREQACVSLSLEEGANARDALLRSGLPEQYMLELDGDNAVSIGIYGKRCDLSTRLKSGDRVEIYRPLRLSPSEARKLRAARNMGGT